jgi:hypothetical protein
MTVYRNRAANVNQFPRCGPDLCNMQVPADGFFFTLLPSVLLQSGDTSIRAQATMISLDGSPRSNEVPQNSDKSRCAKAIFIR